MGITSSDVIYVARHLIATNPGMAIPEAARYATAALEMAAIRPDLYPDANAIKAWAHQLAHLPIIASDELALRTRSQEPIYHGRDSIVGVLELDPEHGTVLAWYRTPDLVGEAERGRIALEGLRAIYAEHELAERGARDPYALSTSLCKLMRSLGMEVD